MSSPPVPVTLAAQIALLSLISFGGIPSVLPDIHNLVVVTKGWATDREFADFYAIAQAMPGLPMILMMSLIGWKVGGLAGALASAGATCGPSSAVPSSPSVWVIASAMRHGNALCAAVLSQ
jgi:chromate transporter